MNKCVRWVAVLVVTVGSVLVATSCASNDDRTPVLVMAAASLTDAFGDVEIAFERLHDDVDIRLNLAGSAALREQILQGAPADVFASANQATMQQLVDAGAVEEPVVFATNTVTIAVPTGNPGGVQGLEDLADDSLFIGLCAQGVPCGDAARDVLDRAGVVAAVDTNEGDVRALLTKIEAGELDAGVVYRTDIIASEAVEEIALNAEAGAAVAYPIAIVDGAPNREVAERFVDFVFSPEGRSLLGDAGFGAP